MTTLLEPDRVASPQSASPAERGRGGRSLVAVSTVVVAFAGVAWWGSSSVARDPRIHVSAAPFVGTWATATPSLRLAMPLVVAVLVVRFGPGVARKAPWSAVVATSGLASLAWTVSLAATDGWFRLAAPLATRYEYLAAVEEVGRPGQFLRAFTERLPGYPTHVKGHPPGMVLLLWTLDRVGLGGAGWAAALVLFTAAAGTAAVLVTVAALAGRSIARRVAPFLVLLPAAVWVGTSADGFFAGIGAIAVATAIQAVVRSDRSSRAWAIAAGLLFTIVAFLSYGLVLLGLVPAAVALQRRRYASLALIGITAVVGLGAIGAITGFWWSEGLQATRTLQLAGVASRRPTIYFAIANLVVAAISVGPAALAALPDLRRPSRLLALPAGALAAVLVADLSGFSKGEVERIWLPFVPWLAVVVGAVGPRRVPRAWLAANAAVGLGLQLLLRSPW